MFSEEIAFDISMHKQNGDYYFNHKFIEDCVTRIIELKNEKVFIDLIEYVELACQAADEAYLEAVENNVDAPAPEKTEVECFGKPISCLATSFLSSMYNEFGTACTLGEEFEEAEEHFNTSLKYNNSNTLSLYNLADVSHSQQNYEATIGHCDNLLAIDEKHIPALYLKASSFYALEDIEGALPLFIKTTELDDSSLGAHFWVAECSRRLGDYATARDHFKRVTELSDYSHVDSIKGYAISEINMEGGDLQLALELCDKAIRKDALNQIGVYEIKGNAYLKMGNITDGARAHARLVTLQASSLPVCVATAEKINNEQGYDSMLEYVNEILSFNPDVKESFSHLVNK